MKLRLGVLVFLISLTSCEKEGSAASLKIEELPETLVVVSRNAPTTWYEGRDGPLGPEYDLVKSFADFHQIKFRIENVDSINEVLSIINKGDAHLAAAGLTLTDKRISRGFLFGPRYHSVQQQVVCRRRHGDLPRKVEDLIGKKIHVIANSSYVERLNELKLEYPDLIWEEFEDMGTEQLLENVWLKKIDCTVADSNIVSINRRFYPELVVAFPITEEQSLAWVLHPDWKHLKPKIESWLEQSRESGDHAVIHERYYGHVELYDYVDMRKFLSRIKKRLPKYEDDFKRVGEKYGVDWLLLAAQSYQESHWNPKAKSPTGVRGMMMLTLNTAKQLGVKSRLDAKQSIEGGAKYLAQLTKRVPDTVQGNNRTWFALAGYNVGFGHLRDARTLTRKLSKNPDQWVDLKDVFPLLAQKKYYKELKYGYARGTEPVRYVQRIRDYLQVLRQHYNIQSNSN